MIVAVSGANSCHIKIALVVKILRVLLKTSNCLSKFRFNLDFLLLMCWVISCVQNLYESSSIFALSNA